MPVNELNTVAEWIYGVLSGSSIVSNAVGLHPGRQNVKNIYEEVALQGATFPFVRFHMTAAVHAHGSAGNNKIFLKSWYNITCTDAAETFETVSPVADEIENLFYQNQQVSDPVVIGCRSLNPIKNVLVEDGIRYVTMGSRIEIFSYKQ